MVAAFSGPAVLVAISVPLPSLQCGISGNIGNTVMDADQQMAKLKLVVDTAREVRGEA